jgi:acetyl-CoA carboxylase biotin carboxylase subunit
MLAKVICWGPTRDEAIQRMVRALREYVVVGIQTNVPFHLQLLDDPRFRAGEFHTGFLENEFKMESPDGHPDERAALLVAAVLSHLRRRRPSTVVQQDGSRGSGWLSAGRERTADGRLQAQRRGWRS